MSRRRHPRGGARRTPPARALATALFAATALLAGCASVGRDYQPPAAAAPARWAGETPSGPSTGLEEWWNAYHDPALIDLSVTRPVVEAAVWCGGRGGSSQYPVGFQLRGPCVMCPPVAVLLSWLSG